MALSAPSGYASSDLVFQEDFSGTTLGGTWHNYITSNAANGWPWNSNGSGGSGPGGLYGAEYDMPGQVTVSNGTLDLTAVRSSVSGIKGGVEHTYPITSGVVSSYGNFEFTGGFLQISMKAPSGDGAWPGLWLLPGKGAGSSGDNFEVDIQEGGFTEQGPPNQVFAAHLHTPNGTFGKEVDTGVDLTTGFHTYGIDWVPGESITWYLDGEQVAQVTSAQMPIPSQPMELIMNNQVANSNASGWHTVLGNSTPWSMQMQIDWVRLYQKPGSGGSITGANVSPTAPASDPVTTPPVVASPVNPPPTIATPTTEAHTAPVLSVADHSLSVPPHGTIDLGLSITSFDPQDSVTVNIEGLLGYESITDSLDGQIFRGKDITLTAAQVDSGLALHSSYRGSGEPTATLTATATAKDSVTGAVATSAAQAITVSVDPAASVGTSYSHANNGFALLNQYMACGGSTGRFDSGQIATAASKTLAWPNESFLTQPQH